MDNNEIYVFGHKKPDTDSITSSIALAYLKRQLGYNAVPMALGGINRETRFALKYFDVPEPRYLNDVKLKVKDINYKKGYHLTVNDSIYGAYTYMNEKKIGNIPVIDSEEENNFIGTISMKDIADDMFNGDMSYLKASYDNILSTIEAQEVLRFDDIIEGNIIVASYKSTRFIETVKINPDSIVIVGDRHSVIEYVVNNGAKLIVLTGNSQIKEEHLEIAKQNHVNVICSPLDTFRVNVLINACSNIETTNFNRNIYTMLDTAPVSEFVDIAETTKFSNFPVLDKDGKYLGVIRLGDLAEKVKRKVILVDHNEYEQSVDGLDEAEIIEIIDHHKIGSVGTATPINFRNMPVGSTNTIINLLYRENGIIIPKEIAGLMLSGIISDTLLFKSPTTTELDKKTVEELSKIAGVDYNEYGMEMLKAGSSIKGKRADEIIFADYKKFTIDNKKVAIGQVSTFNFNEFKENQDEYVRIINETARNQDYAVVSLFVTDLGTEGSYVFYNDDAKTIFEKSFGVKDFVQGTYLPGCVSRKKQMVPKLMEYMEK